MAFTLSHGLSFALRIHYLILLFDVTTSCHHPRVLSGFKHQKLPGERRRRLARIGQARSSARGGKER